MLYTQCVRRIIKRIKFYRFDKICPKQFETLLLLSGPINFAFMEENFCLFSFDSRCQKIHENKTVFPLPIFCYCNSLWSACCIHNNACDIWMSNHIEIPFYKLVHASSTPKIIKICIHQDPSISFRLCVRVLFLRYESWFNYRICFFLSFRTDFSYKFMQKSGK